MRGLFACAAAFLLAVSGRAELFIAVPLRPEPPQEVRAVVLNAGGNVYACQVRNGQLLVPVDAPLPWTVAQLRFEATTYTARDRELKAPLVLREFGEIRVRFRPMSAQSDAVRVWMLRNGEQKPAELALRRDGDSFSASLAPGTYAGAFFTDSRGTRIRSGIVIPPGQVAELGEIALEPTGSVTLRVVDGKSKRPVQGAKVTWSPPAALNAEVAKQLFSSAWSATTDRSGVVTVRSIGPPPVPARWAVEARGYAPTITQQVLIGDTQRVVVPDTPLRPESIVIVDFLMPRDDDPFEDATLVVSAREEGDNLRRWNPLLRQALREGENKLKLSRFGTIRFSIESKEGRKLLWQDVELTPDDTRVTIAPIPTEITGVVRRDKMPVEGVFITVADGHDVKMIVGKATTDASGRYSISTFQSGDVVIYTNGPYASRESSASVVPAAVVKHVRLAGETEKRVDFQLPTSAAMVIVVDAESRAPLRATIQGLLMDKNFNGNSVYLETDDRGTAKLVGREGKVKAFVRAKGYRSRELTFDVGKDLPPTTIELTPGGVLTGRVLDPAGAPVAHAQILGGFPELRAPQGQFQTSTDATGRFEIEGAEPGTTFYVVASGHALAVTTLRENTENVVRLATPNAGALRVVEGQGPPQKLVHVAASPRGGAVIPDGVLMELAEANGLSIFQLTGTGKDGTLILPEFLAPGSYSLYRVRPTGKPFAEAFDPITELRVPAPAGTIVTIPD